MTNPWVDKIAWISDWLWKDCVFTFYKCPISGFTVIFMHLFTIQTYQRNSAIAGGYPITFMLTATFTGNILVRELSFIIKELWVIHAEWDTFKAFL